jgi:hypothetical protein
MVQIKLQTVELVDMHNMGVWLEEKKLARLDEEKYCNMENRVTAQ